MPSSKVFPDGKTRCSWVPRDKQYYIDYHDEEWGRSVHDDKLHFEMLCLEGAQSGLSWATILRKRNGYRSAFHGFDVDACAALSEEDLSAIAQGERGDVVRHRAKVNSVRNNARTFKQIQEEFGSFDAYVWKFVGPTTMFAYLEAAGLYNCHATDCCAFTPSCLSAS